LGPTPTPTPTPQNLILNNFDFFYKYYQINY